MDRMGFEPTAFAGFLLTQCECVIQTKLDDRSKLLTKQRVFLSLGLHKLSHHNLVFFYWIHSSHVMSLQEFDALISQMQRSLDYAISLGQPVEAARILYQMNEQLPSDMQLDLDDLENESQAKSFVSENLSSIKYALSEYRQTLF